MKLTKLMAATLSFLPALAAAHGAHESGVSGFYHALVHLLISHPLLVVLAVVVPVAAYWFLKSLNR